MGAVWKHARGRFFTLFAPLGLVLALVFVVLDLTAAFVSFGGVAQMAAFWLQTLIGIGILTRLYMGFFGAEPVGAEPVSDSAGVA